MCIIAALALLYFFVWRPSDGDYQAASAQLEALRSASSSAQSAAQAITHSPDINQAAVDKLEEAANKYNNSLASLAANTAIARDSGLKAAYDTQKSSLATYGKSLTSLASSLKSYYALLTDCTDFTYEIANSSSADDFDSQSLGCKTAIEKAGSSSYTPFKQSFLDDYVVLAKDMLNAYQRLVAAEANNNSLEKTRAENTLLIIQEQIVAMRKNKLELSPDSNPVGAINAIKKMVSSQQSQIIR